MSGGAVAAVLLAVALAACGSPSPPSSLPASIPLSSASSLPSSLPSPSAEPAVVDFGGTAWRVEALDGQALPLNATPTLEFDIGGARTGSGTGFSGCGSFAFDWTLDAGRARLRPVGVDLGTCTGIAAQVETTFLATLVGATAYSGSGDLLTIAGAAGPIQLRRDVPPVGDPGRGVLDLLRSGQWRVIAAPGVAPGTGLTGLRFTDTVVLAVGECGLAGRYRLFPQGRVRFEEVGWDTVAGCEGRPGAVRAIVAHLLGTATTARIGADGATIVFSGPDGELVLGR